MKTLPCFQDIETKKEIQSLCKEYEINIRLLQDLCEIALNYSGSGRHYGIQEDITACIDRFMGNDSDRKEAE
jgi:hypothetical protein